MDKNKATKPYYEGFFNGRDDSLYSMPMCPNCKEPSYSMQRCPFCNQLIDWIDTITHTLENGKDGKKYLSCEKALGVYTDYLNNCMDRLLLKPWHFKTHMKIIDYVEFLSLADSIYLLKETL